MILTVTLTNIFLNVGFAKIAYFYIYYYDSSKLNVLKFRIFLILQTDPGSPLIYQGKLMGVAYMTRCNTGYSYGVFLLLQRYVDEMEDLVGQRIQ